MTIRFQTKMQAQKALGRSGRVFGGTLMIGVAPCHDPPAEATNVSNILDQTGGHHHPADSSVLSLNSSLAPHNRSIRPLTQSYKAAHNEHEVSKNNNLFSLIKSREKG
jgi:nuclear pore complex protein Nup53